MNILLDNLPTEVDGIEINSDFRISILFEMLMQDTEISNNEKIITAIDLYYPDKDKILDINKAIENIIWFYKCGKEVEKQQNNMGEKSVNSLIYSYEYDDKYIYSAFMQQYKIDLNEIKYLHWWKFKSMFDGLSDDTQLVKIMGYRSVDLSKIQDKKTKEHYKKLKNIYKLPDMRSNEEKENDFGRAFW